MNTNLKNNSVGENNQTFQDYKIIVPSMVNDLIYYAGNKKTLWEAITPTLLGCYAFLFYWYQKQGQFLINNEKPVFLKDLYDSYKICAEAMRYEPVGKTVYLQQLKIMFEDLKTKKHCMGVQISRKREHEFTLKF